MQCRIACLTRSIEFTRPKCRDSYTVCIAWHCDDSEVHSKRQTFYSFHLVRFLYIYPFIIYQRVIVAPLTRLSVNYDLCTISTCFLYGVKVDIFPSYGNLSANVSNIVLYYCDHDYWSSFNLRKSCNLFCCDIDNLIHRYQFDEFFAKYSILQFWLQCLTLSNHLPRDVRNFAAGDGRSCLSHMWTYSRPDAAIVACDRRPQGFISLKSWLPPGHLVTLVLAANALHNIT